MNSLVTFTEAITPPKNFSSILSQPSYYNEIKLSLKPDLIAGIPDGILALLLPIISYWSFATFFHIIDVYELAEKYRIHPSEEEQSRNKATMKDVLQDVVLQHIIQTIIGWVFYHFEAPPKTGHEMYEMWRLKGSLPSYVPDAVIYYGYTYGWTIFRICIATLMIDSWQYWLHRIMHMNKYLYRRFHSRHHKLYVPYAYGALYNDPVEGFLLDTFGTGIAGMICCLTPRENIFLYTFATLKTVDDHCGYRLPYDIFQIIFPNNAIYHDIHHQNWGIKYNFSQPFFTMWDKFTKTQYTFVNEYKELQEHITLTKYKEFLESKKRRNVKKEE